MFLANWNCEDLKVGDKVLETYSGYSSQMRVSTVAKVNKLHIVLDNGKKYSKVSHTRVGDTGYHRFHIEPFDTERWEKFVREERLRHMRTMLTHYQWGKTDDALIEAIFALLP